MGTTGPGVSGVHESRYLDLLTGDEAERGFNALQLPLQRANHFVCGIASYHLIGLLIFRPSHRQ